MSQRDASPDPARSTEVGSPGSPPPLPDLSASLPWRSWADGRHEAARERRPIFAFASPRWSNGAQRFARYLDNEASLRDTLTTRFVPIRIDPLARPDLAGAMRWAALRLGPTAGPPIALFLDERGGAILPYGTLFPEGRDAVPSLASTVRSFAESYERDRGRAIEEALSLDATAIPERTSTLSDEGAEDVPDITHLHPQRVQLLLDRIETGSAEGDTAESLGAMLEKACRGGVRDQLGGGFHLCARDPGWIVPHFEKIAPHNAQLAATLARAARLLDRADLLVPALECARFAEQALDRGVRGLGADAPFYTWTAKEASQALPPDLLQAVGLAYHVTPSAERHVLYRALTAEEMQRYSHEPVEVLERRVSQGRLELRRARSRRRPPEPIEDESPCWDAETVRWLAEAARHDLDVDPARLGSALERLVATYLDSRSGLLVRSDGSTFLHDQVSALAAASATERLGVEGSGSDTLRSLMPAVLERFVEDGAVLDRPSGLRSTSVVDAEAPSAIGTLIEEATARGHALPNGLQRQGDASTWSWSLQRHGS